MHLSAAHFSRREDDTGPVDRLNGLEPGARAGVITGIVVGTVLIVVLSTWWCCWPCCCFPSKKKHDANRFKNHEAAVEADQHDPQSVGNTRAWENRVAQHGFAPNTRHEHPDAPKDPSEPPPAYHEIK